MQYFSYQFVNPLVTEEKQVTECRAENFDLGFYVLNHSILHNKEHLYNR